MIGSLKLAATTITFVSKSKLWIKKSWAWIRVNGHIVFLVAAGLILFVATRKSVDFSKILTSRKKAYEDEIETLKGTHEKEVQDREAATRRYQAAIKQIEEKYTSDSMRLENNKKAEIKRLIQSNPDNPEEITKKIAELTGFNVVGLD